MREFIAKNGPGGLEVGWDFDIVYSVEPTSSGDEMTQIDQRPHKFSPLLPNMRSAYYCEALGISFWRTTDEQPAVQGKWTGKNNALASSRGRWLNTVS